LLYCRNYETTTNPFIALTASLVSAQTKSNNHPPCFAFKIAIVGSEDKNLYGVDLKTGAKMEIFSRWFRSSISLPSSSFIGRVISQFKLML